MIDHFLEMLPGFVLHLLVYCSAVWSLAADTHLKLLDRAVTSGARFPTGGVFECDILIVVLLQFFVSCIRSCVLLSVITPWCLCNPTLPGCGTSQPVIPCAVQQ